MPETSALPMKRPRDHNDPQRVLRGNEALAMVMRARRELELAGRLWTHQWSDPDHDEPGND